MFFMTLVCDASPERDESVTHFTNYFDDFFKFHHYFRNRSTTKCSSLVLHVDACIDFVLSYCQICTNEHVLLFDMVKLGKQGVMEGLASVVETAKVMKVSARV